MLKYWRASSRRQVDGLELPRTSDDGAPENLPDIQAGSAAWKSRPLTQDRFRAVTDLASPSRLTGANVHVTTPVNSRLLLHCIGPQATTTPPGNAAQCIYKAHDIRVASRLGLEAINTKMSDIRSFFAPKGGAPLPKPALKKAEEPPKSKRTSTLLSLRSQFLQFLAD